MIGVYDFASNLMILLNYIKMILFAQSLEESLVLNVAMIIIR